LDLPPAKRISLQSFERQGANVELVPFTLAGDEFLLCRLLPAGLEDGPVILGSKLLSETIGSSTTNRRTRDDQSRDGDQDKSC
jgi:hypothetical protein